VVGEEGAQGVSQVRVAVEQFLAVGGLAGIRSLQVVGQHLV
jgi:hypothetical protein